MLKTGPKKAEAIQLSARLEDYLETIAALIEEHGNELCGLPAEPAGDADRRRYRDGRTGAAETPGAGGFLSRAARASGGNFR